MLKDSVANDWPRTPLLSLTRFESPLPAKCLAEQVDRFTATEHARFLRISLPLRREQFAVGHRMLRWLLAAVGFDEPQIEVDIDGRPRLVTDTSTYISVAHSANTVVAIVASGPVGVDLESMQAMRDPRAAAALLGMPADSANDSDSVLRAWVAAEARLKAGQRALPYIWRSTWDNCQLAVAGIATPPLTGVFEAVTGTYNAAELQWEAV